MTIVNNIHRITQAKTDLKSVIEKRGIAVHEKATVDYYPDILDNSTYIVNGTFIPEEDTKIFSVSELPFVPTYFSFVCPEECTINTSKGVLVAGVGAKGFNSALFYKTASGGISYAFVISDSSSNPPVYGWETDSFTMTVPSNKDSYFKKGLTYMYVISGEIDPNRHAEYFSVTSDGEISLKPDVEIPAELVIPEVVNSISVERLSEGMFLNNKAIEVLTIPNTISDIPANFCNGAVNLKRLNNTGHIVKVGEKAFSSCKLERVMMPNLEQLGAQAFGRNAHLVYADIGKVSVIEESTFRNDITLTEVEGDGTITSVGEGAFGCTWSLKDMTLTNSLTSIGDYGFLRSGYDYDWSSLTDCTFGTKSTSAQVNPTDFWSSVVPKPCANRLPTQLCQYDERWVENTIGQSTTKYRAGCSFLALLHAYCGIKNLKLSTVFEFEDIVNSINPDLLNTFTGHFPIAANILNELGVKATLVNKKEERWNEEMLSELYSTLNNGGYALVSVQTEGAHAVVVYGVNENGELLFLDSNGFYPYDYTKPAVGKLKVQQLIADKREFVLVKKS